MNNGTELPGKGLSTGAIVLINLGILVLYTLISKSSRDGIFFDAFCIVLHVIVCLGIAIAVRKWTWVLGATVVLIVGFSTCVRFLT